MGCGKSKDAKAQAVPSGEPADWEALLGAELDTKDGRKPTKELLAGKKAVMIYFSAHWCPPCRGFTPVLAKAYTDYTAGDVEVVFVSSDKDEQSFNEYYGSMPWAALPYNQRDLKGKVAGRHSITGIPALVVLKPDGTVACENGRGEVQRLGTLDKALTEWGL
uniref:protein-disulfide reductase n=1 Tax=Alexandrium catenella TaxID=2925 RepID=A0A7S1QQ79_ALECA